jgi:hypothetical protein
MSTEHPITPSPELVELWLAEIWHEGTPVRVAASDLHIATQAARWGADHELEACCEWISLWCPKWPDGTQPEGRLRATRRPKPLSLKEQALVELDAVERLHPADYSSIRRALEALND